MRGKIAFCLMLLFELHGELAAQSYSITDLGALCGPGAESFAGGLNNQGQVTGSTESPNCLGWHGFFWSSSSGMQSVRPLVPSLAFGNDINDRGQVVGYSSAGGVQIHAISWEGGTTRDIHFGEHAFSRANAINLYGTVAGVVQVPGSPISQYRAAVRASSGKSIELGTFGGSESRGEDINDFDQVVGMARNAQGAIRAFLYEQGVMTDIGSLGGVRAWAQGINNDGWIIGRSLLATGEEHAFLHDGQGMIDLGTLGGSESDARGINLAGDIVGAADDSSQLQRAFLLPRGGAMLDLNRQIPSGTGWNLTGAHAINELGEICGTGFLNGVKHAYLLEPVYSEPRVSGLVPGIANVENTVYLAGARPGARLMLFYDFQTGTTSVPQCSGLVLDLARPKPVATLVADSRGRGSLRSRLPQAARGKTVWVQALDKQACEKSAARFTRVR